MRPSMLLPALVLLAACGEGSSFDREFKKAYREKGISACVTAARATSGGQAPEDLLTRLCTCTTDRTMEGRSAQDLTALRPDGPEVRAAAEACFREQAGAAVAGTAKGA